MRFRSTPLIPALMMLATGCQNEQSVLEPQGPQAVQIAHLAWVLIAICSIVLAVVLVTLWLALRGSTRVRARLAQHNTVILAGIVFPAATLTGLLGYSVWLMQAKPPGSSGEDVLRIEVVGEQWWWRVAYIGADASVASANEIRIPVGRNVEFTLKSADVIHSFWVPSLGGKVDMIPGRTTQLRLAAARPGVYRGQCAEYCGGPHALMALPIVAMPAAEHAIWLTHEAAPAREPASEAERRGKSIFVAAGCGACHAIRGTEARATIGPDLTRIGARHSVAIDTMPLTAANLERFLLHGQSVKPGNTMPEFRVLSQTDREALVTYLLSLR
jgi:cytochrome c oxidase subunit II